MPFLRSSSLQPPLFSCVTALSLAAGCLAHAPESSQIPSELDDGLPQIRMAFLMRPDKWEELKRAECESDPASGACVCLFERAASRLRWGIRTDEAPGLVVHACAQGHLLSCAAVDLLASPSLDQAEKLARLGCSAPMKNMDCHSTAELLAYACNTLQKAAPCVVLSDLFEKSDEPDPVWARRYRERACSYGSFCGRMNVAGRAATSTLE